MDFLKESQKDVEVARTLVKNRLATDLNDAMRQIQQRRDTEKSMIEGTRKSEPDTVRITGVTATGTTPSMISRNDAEKMREVEAFLKRFDQFFSKFYQDTQSKLADMSKDICAMKDQIQNLRLYARGGQQSEHQANISITEEAPAAKPAAAAQEKSHPRSGSFTPGDVSIENIFSNAGGRMQQRKK